MKVAITGFYTLTPFGRLGQFRTPSGTLTGKMAGIANSEIAPKTEFSTVFLQEHFSILHLDHRQCLQNAQSVPAGTLRSLDGQPQRTAARLPTVAAGKAPRLSNGRHPRIAPLENDQMFLQERFAE